MEDHGRELDNFGAYTKPAPERERAKFTVGQSVRHRGSMQRGIVLDVNPLPTTYMYRVSFGFGQHANAIELVLEKG